jgi:hypothetical protein
MKKETDDSRRCLKIPCRSEDQQEQSVDSFPVDFVSRSSRRRMKQGSELTTSKNVNSDESSLLYVCEGRR